LFTPLVKRIPGTKRATSGRTALKLRLNKEGVPVVKHLNDPEAIMKIELHCHDCCSRFSAAADTPADDIVDRMIDDGPWYALASGETFEEMVRAALTDRGRILCPDCGQALSIREGGLYRHTRELTPCG
jgi:hypothetical protein